MVSLHVITAGKGGVVAAMWGIRARERGARGSGVGITHTEAARKRLMASMGMASVTLIPQEDHPSAARPQSRLLAVRARSESE
jgi:hypothetical protein